MRRLTRTTLGSCSLISLALVAGCGSHAEPAAPHVAATRPAVVAPATKPAVAWKQLFNGKNLDGWKTSDFGGSGEVSVEDGHIVLPAGEGITAVMYPGELPKMDYELSLEAQRAQGVDFFSGITFPFGDTFATLIVGGWGGAVVGISSLDDHDAAHNETTKYQAFKEGQWYRIRLQVLPDRIVTYIDDEKIIDVNTKRKKVAVRPDIDASKPFALCSWQTTAWIRDVKIRELKRGE